MAGSKKFGTFGGVFTPSILTILGVIMYLRLGWVVGNAGVWGTLIIIGIAHIISITTGLSISSIATDKKVGPGGVYYVLSRSLGLPIGGAIGMTLFVGTALSIALYLIGFAESFNSYLGFDTSINGLRITGSIALMSLMTIALISTAVAIKTQFVIMAAIAVSLVSIFIGLAGQTPQPMNSFGVEGGASMETIFAIFFPAVTGFTAGIAMSGDLKNSKKSIPSGTLWAIVVGFVVYAVLAVAISMSIDSGLLVTDNNILLSISYSAPAVVAGIWGATLSSALGGILGGPRILQAMSMDKITPKLFGKGRGKDQEPWNALFLTIFIAQCGILIGELDLIARVVSMFYLAAYGFINISYFLESWASPDFNPTFKVKRWIALVGFVACFAVMFKLDMMAMFAAFIVIGGIYYWLSKRQIALGTGDIWQSVWNTVVRRGLKRLEKKEDHLRNWKPNILLFSGGTNQRPHLLEMSRSISGKSGIVTNFDLIENPEASSLFPKHKQVVRDELLETYGIFGRRIEVQNVFKGIENIASTFGFSGVEPNTVLMGWAKNTQDPIWFANMTTRLKELDLNVLYLDYDERFGFGDKATIDIWWRDQDQNQELSLSVAKFLSNSDDWRSALIRVIVVNNTLDEGMERKVHKKLDEYRIQASVKVIHNAIEQRDFYALMENISTGTDLILAGIPSIEEGSEKDFVSSTNKLFEVLGTTLLLRSSSQLDAAVAVHKKMELEDLGDLELIHVDEDQVTTLPHAQLQEPLQALHEQMTTLANEIGNDELISFRNNFLNVVNHTKQIIQEGLDALASNPKVDKEAIRAAQMQILNEFNDRMRTFGLEDIPYLAERLHQLSDTFHAKLGKLTTDVPASVLFYPTPEELAIEGNETAKERKAKGRKKFYSGLIKPKVRVPFKTIASYHLETNGLQNFIGFQYKLGLATYSYQNELRGIFIECLQAMDAYIDKRDEVEKEIDLRINGLVDLLKAQHNYLYSYLVKSATHITNLIGEDVSLISAPDVARQMKNKKSELAYTRAEISNFHTHWITNQECVTSQTVLDVSLHEISSAIKSLSERLDQEIADSMYGKAERTMHHAKTSIAAIEAHVAKGEFEAAAGIELDIPESLAYNDLVLNSIMSEFQHQATRLPEKIIALDEESRNNFAFSQGDMVETFSIDILHLADYIIDHQIQHPIEVLLQEIPQECMKGLNAVIQNLRLIRYTLSAQIEEEEKKQQLDIVLEKAKEGLSKSEDVIKKSKRKAMMAMEDIFSTAVGNLTSSYIIDEAENLDAASKANKSRTKKTRLIAKWKKYFTSKWSQLVALISAKKEELTYSGFKSENKQNENLHAKLLAYGERVTPSEETMENLPFYYQQLFTGKHSPKVEFLNNRERELEEAQTAIRRIEHGSNGGILILGESLAGKTLLSEIIAKENCTKNIYKIEAPITGSTREKDLLLLLQKQLKSKTGSMEMIEDAPQGSYFIFDDIELWWERSRTGSEAIKMLVQIIEKYSTHYVFIVNCNLYAYKLIRMQGNFDSFFVGTIQLGPFNARTIKETLLERHQAGGLEFNYLGFNEAAVPERKFRKLMDEYAYLADGNIGVALHQWQANITNVDRNVITIQSPTTMPLPLINDPNWMVLLSQFILHKHLTATRIKRIFSYGTKQEAQFMIQNLQRSGLLEQTMGSSYRIPPYLVGAVIQSLKESKLL